MIRDHFRWALLMKGSQQPTSLLCLQHSAHSEEAFSAPVGTLKDLKVPFAMIKALLRLAIVLLCPFVGLGSGLCLDDGLPESQRQYIQVGDPGDMQSSVS